MKIRITDIPTEGRKLDFELDLNSINKRANAGKQSASHSPEYVFTAPPTAGLELNLLGSNVSVKGSAEGVFRTQCSQCAEDVESRVSTDINLILKPRTSPKPAVEVEDLGFGSYFDQEVDCGEIVEEHLMLSLPYRVTCEESELAACTNAQASALQKQQGEEVPNEGDERLAVLRNLRLVKDPSSLN